MSGYPNMGHPEILTTGGTSQRAEHPGKNVPRLIAWEVTRQCLLNCKHCRAAAGKASCAGELSTEECFALVDNIASFAKPILILTGGEPMLRADIYDIAKHAHGLGLPVVMAPCGLLLNDETVARIVASGIRRISLSLDGATAKAHDEFRGQAGAFDACLAGIEAAKRAHLDFQINTTVTRHNLTELEDILKLALRLGASVFNPFLLVPTGRGKDLMGSGLSAEEYERTLRWLAEQQGRKDIQIRVTCAPHYQRILRQCHVPAAEGHASHGCMGGKSFAFVSHVGKVQICGFLDVECGDLRAEGLDFRKIWYGSEVFREIRDVDSYRGRCGVCEYRNVCGGCRARAWTMGGDYRGEEPLCSHVPARAAAGAASAAEHSPAEAPAPPQLDDLDRKILADIQAGFPLVVEPYEAVGAHLGCSGADVLSRVRRLKRTGVIRRIGGVFSTARLGYVSTLVAAKVAPERLEVVAAEVSRLENVTHNYAREHDYNLWFTMTFRSREELADALANLRALPGVADMQSLPTIKAYKTSAVFPMGPSITHAHHATGRPAWGGGTPLEERHKALIRLVQESLPLDPQPLVSVAKDWGGPVDVPIGLLREWLGNGVMRRFGAVLSHHSVGLNANAMAMFHVGPSQADEVGALLSAREEISHCYLRTVPEGWGGNLFAMVHGTDPGKVRALVNELAAQAGVASPQILFSTREFKKTSMRFFMEDFRAQP